VAILATKSKRRLGQDPTKLLNFTKCWVCNPTYILLDGATIETLNLAQDNRYGKPKHACATCNPLLAMFKITAISG